MPRKKKEKEVLEELDLEIYTKSGKLRKRKKKKIREYFTQETEDAIVRYLQSENHVERNRIFNESINYSLHKLAENIIHTFKFYYTELDNVQDLKHEVVVFLLEKMHNYDQSKGKAYSYLGTIAKRYLIVYNEDNYKKLKVRADIDAVDDDKKVFNNILSEQQSAELTSFINSYINYVDYNLETLFPSSSDQTIAIAMMEIFKRRENLDVFNKQQFYFYIREITGQSTPSITKVTKELKRVYKVVMKEVYLNGELETDEPDIY
jgi:hypothetical protein